MPMKTTLPTRPGPPGTSPRGHDRAPRDHLLDDLGRWTGCGSARPARWRRTGSSSRSRPGRRRTPWPWPRGGGPGSASAPTRRAPRRTAATASCGSCRRRSSHRADRRQQRRGEGLGQRGAGAGRDVGPLLRVGRQPVEVVRDTWSARNGGRPSPVTTSRALGRRQVGQVDAAASPGAGRRTSARRGRARRSASGRRRVSSTYSHRRDRAAASRAGPSSRRARAAAGPCP